MILDVCDLSSIESRVLGWMSGCQRINDTFAHGRDTYRDMATDLFSVPYDEVTKEQRTFSKPVVLGCGYRLGATTLTEYAEGMGVTMDRKEAHYAVRTFRRSFPEIPNMWYWFDSVLQDVTQTGRMVSGYKVTFGRDTEFLYIVLPSGRRLAYHKPAIEMRTIRWEDEKGEERSMIKPCFTFMGINRLTLKWSRISAHGGFITENIDQGISRDILAHGLTLADSSGLDIRGHVHDEIICLHEESRLEELKWCMKQSPPWAADLSLDAAGYSAKRYRKD